VISSAVLLLTVATPDADATLGWGGGWSVPMQQPLPQQFGQSWSTNGFDNQTVRQVVRITAGGTAIRIRLSNVYGSTPLTLTGATVAQAGSGASIRPGSLRTVTFGLSQSATVPAGRERASDPILLPVAPLESLTVTLYFAEPTGPASTHLLAQATTYRAAGDHRGDTGAAAFTENTLSWFYLDGIDVLGNNRDAVVTFGDSITDGAGSYLDHNTRYPDLLAERLVASGERRPVLNAGISGNRVLNDSPCFGESAVHRFGRDVLSLPRVSTVIILEGINDIGASASNYGCFLPNPQVTAAQLIAGYQTMIARAHANGVQVIGATMLPFKGAAYYTDHGEGVRDEVNDWIRSSGAFDAVVDFDKAMASPTDPDVLNPAYDGGDHLHPNDAGYAAMAQAVALAAL